MHSTDTAFIILNPTSGRERAPKFLAALRETLAGKYAHVFVRRTEKAGDAEIFAKEAAAKNYDVICMGGDGTINETVSGILAVPGTETVFGFIPFGTVNDLARALRIPRAPGRAIRMLRDAAETSIDIGRIGDRYFINIVAAGLIPEAVSRVSIREKTIFGSMAYFAKGLQALGHQRSYAFHIETEAGTYDISSPLMAAMLTDSAGSFRNLLPPEDRKKGFIKLALFRDFAWRTVLWQAPVLLSGRQLSSEFLHVINLKHARITLAEGEELATNVDGEIGPSFPLELELLPDRLRVFVPAGRREEPLYSPQALQYLKDNFMRAARARIHEWETLPEQWTARMIEREEHSLRVQELLPEKKETDGKA